MALGWSCMSMAAINIVVAPWFERKRGVAVSLALTGASCGGVILAPALLALVDRLGFATGVRVAALTMVVMLVPIALVVLGRTPAGLGLAPDGDAATAAPGAAPPAPAAPWRRSDVLRTSRYWTICGAFALGLCAQVGMLTHLVAYLSPMLGTAGVAAALSVTTIGAVAGRFPMGLLVDWMDRRLAACLNFLVQVVGLALLWAAPSPAAIYAGCALFGLGVGNVVSLPGLLVQREFTTAQFATGAIGLLRDGTGSYGVALGLCVALDLVAAGTILLGRPRRRAVSGQRVAKPAPPEEKAAVTNA
jgi:predicted MFS family arabinose efflux permease